MNMNISRLLQILAKEIERVGKMEEDAQRILQGRCVYCGQKLPENSPSYHCEPSCVSDLEDRCNATEKNI